MEQRIEEKYIGTAKDLIVLQKRMQSLLNVDKHANSDNEYVIKSVYLDSYDNRCFLESENGISERSKYRIRMYNNDLSNINLEIKNKRLKYTNKIFTPITLEQFQLVLDRKMLPMLEDMGEAYLKTRIKMISELFAPVVIVQYTREAYTYDVGNVRITFDKNITASVDFEHFLSGDYMKLPILKTGEFILEVKYDEILPRHIYHALGLNGLTQIAFSKYYNARNILKSSFYL